MVCNTFYMKMGASFVKTAKSQHRGCAVESQGKRPGDGIVGNSQTIVIGAAIESAEPVLFLSGIGPACAKRQWLGCKVKLFKDVVLVCKMCGKRQREFLLQ